MQNRVVQAQEASIFGAHAPVSLPLNHIGCDASYNTCVGCWLESHVLDLIHATACVYLQNFELAVSAKLVDHICSMTLSRKCYALPAI